MPFISTRGAGDAPIALADAVRRGLAPDGGLYVPTAITAMAPADVVVSRLSF